MKQSKLSIIELVLKKCKLRRVTKEEIQLNSALIELLPIAIWPEWVDVNQLQEILDYHRKFNQ